MTERLATWLIMSFMMLNTSILVGYSIIKGFIVGRHARLLNSVAQKCHKCGEDLIKADPLTSQRECKQGPATGGSVMKQAQGVKEFLESLSTFKSLKVNHRHHTNRGTSQHCTIKGGRELTINNARRFGHNLLHTVSRVERVNRSRSWCRTGCNKVVSAMSTY